VYVRLLGSPPLLERILLDTVTVQEENGRRTTVMELLGIDDETPALRREHGVRALQLSTSAQEIKTLNAVDVQARTRWPSVSFYLVDRLVRSVNEFNVQRRQSQAGAERQFVDSVARDAERQLRAAEDQLQSFMQTNRVFTGSPQLTFQRERLQREVGLRQQMYTTLLQSREEARIREVRATPVVTLLEPPRVPARPESRKVVLKTLLGLLIGSTVGAVAALLAQSFGRARQTPSEDTAEFLRLVDEVTPRFLRRRRA
jgi:tyrosine-protein kinase Etk/Wzc